MGRLLGVDYGRKRIGLALSDPLRMFASPLTTIEVHSKKQLMADLAEIIKTHEVETLVFGCPKKTTGAPSDLQPEIDALANALQKSTGCAIYFVDERFTSVIAQQSLQAQGVKPSRNKGLVDKTAAALILQQYLDQNP